MSKVYCICEVTVFLISLFQIKYAKPPKPKQDDAEEEISQRRVTRGRQVNYFDDLMMSDETEEEEEV